MLATAMTAMINSQVLFLGTPDLNEYDHIEVLRGADALFAGAGNPGGTVNLVRKHPLDTDELMFSSSAGSWGNVREELDVTGPLQVFATTNDSERSEIPRGVAGSSTRKGYPKTLGGAMP